MTWACALCWKGKSVRKFEGRIRITAQLIDGFSGNHIWADRYDRDYIAIFDLQDALVRDIVASIEYALWITLVREVLVRQTLQVRRCAQRDGISQNVRTLATVPRSPAPPALWRPIQ